jgi:hypothetical protein
VKKEVSNWKGFYPTPPPKSKGEKLLGIIIVGVSVAYFFWIFYPLVRFILTETLQLISHPISTDTTVRLKVEQNQLVLVGD